MGGVSAQRLVVESLSIDDGAVPLEEHVLTQSDPASPTWARSCGAFNKEYFVLEKDGIPVAGILDIDELEDYLELSDPTVKRQIRESGSGTDVAKLATPTSLSTRSNDPDDSVRRRMAEASLRAGWLRNQEIVFSKHLHARIPVSFA